MKNKFQDNFAHFFASQHVFSFWKARVALYAILKGLGVGPADEVILPGYTCVMDVNPIKYLGALPVNVDIEPDTFNLDISLLEEKITPKTKVIIAQHTYGYVCDMDNLLALADKHNITVIEDCCLSLGSTYKGKLCGTFGRAAYFSFQWNKPFTTGLGGMALCHDEKLAENIRQLYENDIIQPSFKEKAMLAAQLAVYRTFIYPRTTAWAQSLFRWLTKKGIVVGSSSTCEYEPVMEKDFFKAMSSIQAHSGVRQVRKVDQNIAHRKKIAQLYDEMLTGKNWLPRQYDLSLQNPVMVRYPVRVTDKQKALALAAGAGIELGSWFECPLHPAETPMQLYNYESGMCPQAEKAAREVVNLPLHPRTSERTARKTVDYITQFTQVR